MRWLALFEWVGVGLIGVLACVVWPCLSGHGIICAQVHDDLGPAHCHRDTLQEDSHPEGHHHAGQWHPDLIVQLRSHTPPGHTVRVHTVIHG